jgi:hypothetical protein
MSNLKELSEQLKTSIDSKIVFEQQVKKQKTLLGTVRLHKGHSLFAMDVDGNVDKVELTGKVILDTKNKKIRHQLNVTDRVFMPALNKSNAIKRFARMGLIAKEND